MVHSAAKFSVGVAIELNEITTTLANAAIAATDVAVEISAAIVVELDAIDVAVAIATAFANRQHHNGCCRAHNHRQHRYRGRAHRRRHRPLEPTTTFGPELCDAVPRRQTADGTNDDGGYDDDNGSKDDGDDDNGSKYDAFNDDGSGRKDDATTYPNTKGNGCARNGDAEAAAAKIGSLATTTTTASGSAIATAPVAIVPVVGAAVATT